MFRIIEAFHNDDENSKRTSGRFIESTCSLLKFEFPPPPLYLHGFNWEERRKKERVKKKRKKKNCSFEHAHRRRDWFIDTAKRNSIVLVAYITQRRYTITILFLKVHQVSCCLQWKLVQSWCARWGPAYTAVTSPVIRHKVGPKPKARYWRISTSPAEDIILPARFNVTLRINEIYFFQRWKIGDSWIPLFHVLARSLRTYIFDRSVNRVSIVPIEKKSIATNVYA